MMRKTIISILVLSVVLIASCKKDKYTTIVAGRVINVGTQMPIEGVKVVIANEVSFSPSHTDTAITDANGNSSIEQANVNEVWVHLRKAGRAFHSNT